MIRHSEQIGSLKYVQVRPASHVSTPQTHADDLVSAQHWATWALHKARLADEVCPDPVRVCRNMGMGCVMHPGAQMLDGAQAWLNDRSPPTVVIAEEACDDPRLFHFDVAHQTAQILLRDPLLGIRSKNGDRWALACAAAILVPPEPLRIRWDQGDRSMEAVLETWRYVPPTAVALRLGERWLADIWVFEQMRLRHTRLRPGDPREHAPKRRDLQIKSLADRRERVAILKAA